MSFGLSCRHIQVRKVLVDVLGKCPDAVPGMVSGQFGAGQFARTIRRDNSSWTIRRKLGLYNINLLKNSVLIQQCFSSIPPPFQQHFSSVPLPFLQYIFINPASISAIFLYQSRFYFSNIFQSIPLPLQQCFFINPAYRPILATFIRHQIYFL